MNLPSEINQKTKGAKKHWTQWGREPDYRFTLANERTFLAWIRTALAVLASGVLLDQFAVGFRHHRLALWVALALVFAAAVMAASSFVRWRLNQIAMRLDGPLDHGVLLPAIAAGLVAVSGALLLLLAL